MVKKIRIRDDDVLVHSREFAGREFKRFRSFHGVTQECPEVFEHVLAVLATEIKEFPEAIEFIKTETAAKRMFPEVHGLHHIDYAALSYDEVVSQLIEAKQFIIETFDYNPTLWYSPWGAGFDARGAHLRPAAAEVGLQLITCEGMIKPSQLQDDVRRVKDNKLSYDDLIKKWEGKEILRHWWEGTGALLESTLFFKKYGQ